MGAKRMLDFPPVRKGRIVTLGAMTAPSVTGNPLAGFDRNAPRTGF